MTLTKQDALYWSGIDTLTIEEGSFLLYGIEPHSFKYKDACTYDAHSFFYDMNTQEDIAHLSEIVQRAALAGTIEIAHRVPDENSILDWQKTHLKKLSFFAWCKSIPKYAITASALDLATYQPTNTPSNELGNDSVPGKEPHTAVGKLSVLAAWRIELVTGKRSSAHDVMSTLQNWAEQGNYPDVLLKAVLPKSAVQWVTGKGIEKTFGLEACQKALKTWNLSRD
jgi:hypothetical protein